MTHRHWLAQLHTAIQNLQTSADQRSEIRAALYGIEEELAVHERLHYNLLQASPDAITVHDEHGAIIEANPAAERIFGYSEAELKRIGLSGLNPSLPAGYMGEFWQRMESNVSETVDTHNLTKDGRSIPVRVFSIAFRIGERKLVAAVARDSSDEQARAKALEQSDQRFNELFTAIDKGVMVHGLSGDLIAINPAAKRILRLVSTDPIVEPLNAHRHSANLQLLDEHFNPLEVDPILLAAQGQMSESRVFGIYGQGEHRYSWISASITPQYRLGEYSPYQVLTIFSDITELKRASEFFEQTQKIAEIGCWEYELKTRRMHWSDGFFELLGFEQRGSMSIDDAFAAVHPSDAQLLRVWWRKQQETPTEFDRDVRARNASGDWIWLKILGKPYVLHGKTWCFRGTAQNITREKTAKDQLTRQTQSDPETGLMNRSQALAVFENKVAYLLEADEISQSHAHEVTPGLMLIDLDRLKLLREVIGEPACVELLNQAIDRLRKLLPVHAELARFSDVELLVLLDVEPDQAIWRIADALTQGFASPFSHQDEEFLLTPAIGVACFPQDGKTTALLLRHLDAASSEAKARSGANWQGFSPGLALKLRQQLQLEAQLRNALVHQEFHLLYQPKINLRTGKLTGVEALVRWNNRLLGELSPNVFIPHAEATGEIVAIGHWVLQEALQQMRTWIDSGVAVPHVAVNVSFRQFVSERFVREIADTLERFKLPGQCLEIELTERVLVEDSFETQQTMDELAKLGVRIVIDDFGEGYSALGYLRRLRVNGLKISHHFLKEIPHSEVDTKVCSAVIAMARSLNLSIVAEGVETPAQCDFLLNNGADVAQGFMFSAPIDANGIRAFLENC